MLNDYGSMVGGNCPCCSGIVFAECCRVFLCCTDLPETALQLMRSRYTAYCLRDVSYLLKTWHPDTRPVALDFTGEDTEWLGLEIIRHEAGCEGDAEGIVAFVANYREGGVVWRLRECSLFIKEAGKWFYRDGVVESNTKPGRNDLCPCGSGKKYKKCCS